MLDYEIEFVEVMPKFWQGHPDGYHQYKIFGYDSDHNYWSRFVFFCPQSQTIGGIRDGRDDINFECQQLISNLDYEHVILKFIRDKLFEKAIEDIDIENKSGNRRRI